MKSLLIAIAAVGLMGCYKEEPPLSEAEYAVREMQCSGSDAGVQFEGMSCTVSIMSDRAVMIQGLDLRTMTFFTDPAEGATREVRGLDVGMGEANYVAFGFCDITEARVNCEASTGTELFEIDARP